MSMTDKRTKFFSNWCCEKCDRLQHRWSVQNTVPLGGAQGFENVPVPKPSSIWSGIRAALEAIFGGLEMALGSGQYLGALINRLRNKLESDFALHSGSISIWAPHGTHWGFIPVHLGPAGPHQTSFGPQVGTLGPHLGRLWTPLSPICAPLVLFDTNQGAISARIITCLRLIYAHVVACHHVIAYHK